MDVAFLLLWPLAMALFACAVCRRHTVLLWSGGLLTVVMGGSVAVVCLVGADKGEAGLANLLLPYTILPFVSVPGLVAGLILLVGGWVRLVRARRSR